METSIHLHREFTPKLLSNYLKQLTFYSFAL